MYLIKVDTKITSYKKFKIRKKPGYSTYYEIYEYPSLIHWLFPYDFQYCTKNTEEAALKDFLNHRYPPEYKLASIDTHPELFI